MRLTGDLDRARSLCGPRVEDDSVLSPLARTLGRTELALLSPLAKLSPLGLITDEVVELSLAGEVAGLRGDEDLSSPLLGDLPRL